MAFGTLKKKDGTPIYLNSVYTVDRTDYPLSTVVYQLSRDPVQTISESRDAVLSAGTEYTVPEYVVGHNNLEVYLDGVRLFAGANGGYTEVGYKGFKSTTIKFSADVAADVQIVARVDHHMCSMHYRTTQYFCISKSTAHYFSKTLNLQDMISSWCYASWYGYDKPELPDDGLDFTLTVDSDTTTTSTIHVTKDFVFSITEDKITGYVCADDAEAAVITWTNPSGFTIFFNNTDYSSTLWNVDGKILAVPYFKSTGTQHTTGTSFDSEDVLKDIIITYADGTPLGDDVSIECSITEWRDMGGFSVPWYELYGTYTIANGFVITHWQGSGSYSTNEALSVRFTLLDSKYAFDTNRQINSTLTFN